ncbi:unnamed protein product, partial [Amoebophrya sp. A120]
MDLCRCYYALRCVLTLVEQLHTAAARSKNSSAEHPRSAFKILIQSSIVELDRLVSCIQRPHLKINVFVQICSLCFVRSSFLKSNKSVASAGPAAAGTISID